MAYDLAKVTANGNNLIAQILANKSSLSVDKIEISDTQLPSITDISTMTSVPKVVQTVSANGFSKNSNTLIISTVVDNSSIRADYKAWVFGIWGSDSQNGQSQLIAVITSTNSPDTIPAFSGSTPVSYTYKFNIGFSNASKIQFNMIDDSFATNDTVVHTTGNETIDGQKKFGTDPIDAAGNAYAKTVDVNQQLDKKVNIADMRKPANTVAGIEEVNAKQDKIGYTPADDSQVAHLSGANNFDTVPTVKNNPLLLASSLPSDLARTGQANTFNSTQTFSQGAKTLQTGSYDDANSLVNEGLYFNTNPSIKNGAGSITTGYIQVMSGYEGFVRQIMYSDTNESLIFHRTSQNGGSSWSNWVQIINWDQIPSVIAFTDRPQTFTDAQTFSIAPTIKDASKDKGDNQAATMADLKSVENLAWIQLKNGTDEIALCRVDGNKLWVVWAFERLGDNQSKSYYIGKVPQSIQGKRFSEFNEIFGGPIFGTGLDTYGLVGGISISSNLIIASYSGYQHTMGYSVYGYFTFK